MKFPWSRGGAARPDTALKRLAREKRPVQVQLEHLGVSFQSVLAVKGRSVVIARPRRLGHALKPGHWLRVYDPDLPDAGLRMPIVHASFLLTNGNTVIVADADAELAGPNQRRLPRYDTSRLESLFLTLPAQQRRFRVLDLSQAGCRVAVGDANALPVLPPDEPVSPAALLARSTRIDLHHVVARTHSTGIVGCAFRAAEDGRAGLLLGQLLEKLAADAAKRLKVNPAV